jgi:hypothetical protein
VSGWVATCCSTEHAAMLTLSDSVPPHFSPQMHAFYAVCVSAFTQHNNSSLLLLFLHHLMLNLLLLLLLLQVDRHLGR